MAELRASERFVVPLRRAAKSCLMLALVIIPTGARTATIDTEHLFGFTIGTDVGEVGEREAESSATGRSGKQTGTYNAASGTLSMETVPIAHLRTEITGEALGYGITGVRGLADQQYGAFGGLSADIRYRFLDRATAPFGFAVGAEPRWGRADDVTGQPANQYGVVLVAAADWEPIRDRVVAAINLLYQPETTRLKWSGTWSQQSTAGVAFGTMVQIRPGLFAGGEARYLRAYDGIGLDTFAGEGFFIGPTIYLQLPKKAWIVLAWTAQVAGQRTVSVGRLDLVNFERRQARFLFGVNF